MACISSLPCLDNARKEETTRRIMNHKYHLAQSTNKRHIAANLKPQIERGARLCTSQTKKINLPLLVSYFLRWRRNQLYSGAGANLSEEHVGDGDVAVAHHGRHAHLEAANLHGIRFVGNLVHVLNKQRLGIWTVSTRAAAEEASVRRQVTCLSAYVSRRPKIRTSQRCWRDESPGACFIPVSTLTHRQRKQARQAVWPPSSLCLGQQVI